MIREIFFYGAGQFCGGGGGRFSIWDLALERDKEEEAAYESEHNKEMQAEAPDDLPPQLLFVHQVSVVERGRGGSVQFTPPWLTHVCCTFPLYTAFFCLSLVFLRRVFFGCEVWKGMYDMRGW